MKNMGAGLGLVTCVLVVLSLAAVASASEIILSAEDAAVTPPVSAGPDAAPNPPTIGVSSVGNAIHLDWVHPDTTLTQYEVWRDEAPYFEPSTGQGTLLDSYGFPQGVYGEFAPFGYVDDGVCGYFVAGGSALECTAQTPNVIVIGDVGHNYFWVVRGGNSGGEFANSNRVGEFEFALVKAS